jgi:hypothetical protein
MLHTDVGTLFGLESFMPNPVRSVTKALILAPEKETVTLLITHSSGQVMMRRVVALDRGANIMPLEFNDYPAGVYVVQLVGSDAFGSKSLRLLKL